MKREDCIRETNRRGRLRFRWEVEDEGGKAVAVSPTSWGSRDQAMASLASAQKYMGVRRWWWLWAILAHGVGWAGGWFILP